MPYNTSSFRHYNLVKGESSRMHIQMKLYSRIYTCACLVYAIGYYLVQPGSARPFTAESMAAQFDSINSELKRLSCSLLELVNRVEPVTDKFFYGASIVARFHRENPKEFDGEGLKYISDTIDQTKQLFPEVEFAASTLHLTLQYSTQMQQALSECIQGLEIIARPEQLAETPKFIADFHKEYERFKGNYSVAKAGVELIYGKSTHIAYITGKLLNWSRFLCEGHRNKLEEAKARLRAGFDDLYEDLGLIPPARTGKAEPTCELNTITKEFDISLAPGSSEAECLPASEGEAAEQGDGCVPVYEPRMDEKTHKNQMSIPSFVLSTALLLFCATIGQH